jgi:asparagine synthase (glutamine-hydrolysing)
MCGIAGIVAPNVQDRRTALGQMMSALRHRGPDGDGTFFASGCALAHTRLSIIDIAGGAQPMLSPDRQAAVVFNGEVYGYQELRAGLQDLYQFRTASDTEVLLALYQKHGLAMLDRLPGMFAFAIWDASRHELFCARDRFGEKPLFYAIADDGTFVFGSEIKSIIASGLIDPVIDVASVAHYLRYLYVHPHRTIYRNIHVVPPAHRLVFSAGRVVVEPYCALPAAEPGDSLNVDEAVDQFRELLGRAVAKQLIADVPVGAFLSGGLDSSTIVALMAQHGSKCKTFSFGFGPVIDERPFARGIADRYGTDHIELSAADSNIADEMVRMSSVYDEPFADSSNIPTYLLCREARKHVKVALTGEGSDELLAGYSYWYRALYDMEEAGARNPAVALLARVITGVCRRVGVAAPETIAHMTSGAALRQRFDTIGSAHSSQSRVFDDATIGKLLGRAAGDDRSDWGYRTLDETLRGDLTTYLPGDILVKADRASMAHGLELRAPFLDWDFASFCIRLPLRLKITRDTDKVILRRAFADAWTPAIRQRGKQGFGAPVAHWLQQPAVDALKNDILGNRASRVYDLVSYQAAQDVARHGDYRTWTLMVLALWMESLPAAPQVDAVSAAALA